MIYQASYPDTTDLDEDDKKTCFGVDLAEWRKTIKRLAVVPTTSAFNWTRNGQYLAVASGKTLRLLPQSDSKLPEVRVPLSSAANSSFAWSQDGKTALVSTLGNCQTRLDRVLVASPLLDIENLRDWNELSSRDLTWLSKNGFVAAGEPSPQMYHVYENTDYENLPIFVTSDSLLHLNHLMFDYLLRGVETEELMPTTIALIDHHLREATTNKNVKCHC